MLLDKMLPVTAKTALLVSTIQRWAPLPPLHVKSVPVKHTQRKLLPHRVARAEVVPRATTNQQLAEIIVPQIHVFAPLLVVPLQLV